MNVKRWFLSLLNAELRELGDANVKLEADLRKARLKIAMHGRRLMCWEALYPNEVSDIDRMVGPASAWSDERRERDVA